MIGKTSPVIILLLFANFIIPAASMEDCTSCPVDVMPDSIKKAATGTSTFLFLIVIIFIMKKRRV
jgi:hypothetical protein